MKEKAPGTGHKTRSSRRASGRRIERPVSAGGVVYRSGDGRVDVVVCGRREPPRWSLPKGTPDVGETIEQTALREVREETGLEVVIKEPIDHIEYWFQTSKDGVLYHKTVHFFLMAPRGGSTERHDPEFDEVKWLPIEQAAQQITYPNEVRILEKARQIIGREASHGQG